MDSRWANKRGKEKKRKEKGGPDPKRWGKD
jgi:hypothetical protein